MTTEQLITFRSMIEDGQFQAALHHIDELLRDLPSSGEGLVLRAFCLAQTDQAELAEEVARSGLASSTDKRLGYLVLSRILSHRGDHGGALSAIENAIQLDPEQVEFWCQKAIIQRARRRSSDSEASIRKALSLNSGHPFARKLHKAADSEGVPQIENSQNQPAITNPHSSSEYSRLLLCILQASDQPIYIIPQGVDGQREGIWGRSAMYRWVHDYSKWIQENPWLEFGCMFASAVSGFVIGRMYPDAKSTNDGWVAIFRGFVVYSYLNWMSLSLKYLFLSMNSGFRERMTPDENREALVVGGIFMFTGVLMTGRFTDPVYYGQAIGMSLFMAIPASRIFRPRFLEARFLVLMMTLALFCVGLGPTLIASFVEVMPGQPIASILKAFIDKYWICLAVIVVLLRFVVPSQENS